MKQVILVAVLACCLVGDTQSKPNFWWLGYYGPVVYLQQKPSDVSSTSAPATNPAKSTLRVEDTTATPKPKPEAKITPKMAVNSQTQQPKKKPKKFWPCPPTIVG